jgi:tetratricopeptide (TPR) repeat protein
MNRKTRRFTAILVALSLMAPGLGWTQDQAGVAGRLNAGYDLLEQGKFDQAQKVFEEVLRQDPGHPLALNNLAAIMVKQGKFDQALACLKRALPRSRGFKVALNRVCSVDGVCAACRMGEEQFGTEDLEGVVKSNILMVEMAKSSRPEKKYSGQPAIPAPLPEGRRLPPPYPFGWFLQGQQQRGVERRAQGKGPEETFLFFR